MDEIAFHVILCEVADKWTMETTPPFCVVRYSLLQV